MRVLVIRSARPDDVGFLTQMLVEAASWRPDGPRLEVADVRARPDLARYVAGWPRPGDVGVVAVDVDLDAQDRLSAPDRAASSGDAGRRVGAAWLRRFGPADPGYGFVDAHVPELSVGVEADRRGQGVGSALLEALLTAAREAGTDAVSLSVESDNGARRLYERLGFRVVAEGGGALTMLLRL